MRRRALEIRSEGSAPALIRPHSFGGNLGLFVPDVFRFGRAGNGRYRLRRWRSWAAAGSARTRQGTLGSLDSPFAAAPLGESSFCLEAQAQAVTTTAQRRRFALRLHQKRTPAVCAVTITAQTASPKRGSSCARPQAACRVLKLRFIPKHTQLCTQLSTRTII